MPRSSLLVWFWEVDKDDIGLVGGKGANLGEMARAGFAVPSGFIITVKAYYQFLKQNDLEIKIKHLLNTADFGNPDSLAKVSAQIKKVFMRSHISDELIYAIFTAYKRLGGVLRDALVAVRSSATAEDLPSASFAGQQETFLNVHGEANLSVKVKEAWASLYTPRAIFYRHQHRFDQKRVGIALIVQKMVASDTSGVLFTLDPVTNDKRKIVIEAIYGLGEMIVQGAVTPDHYEVSKQTLSILTKHVEAQPVMLKRVGVKTKEIRVKDMLIDKQKITDRQITELATLGRKLEKHYYFPQDVEWAIEKGKISIVQTRPVTTIKNRKLKIENRMGNMYILVRGDPASPGIASGPVRIVNDPKRLHAVCQGDVLVAPQTNPDYVPAMRKAVAIVTEKGGRTSHAAIVSRELGIPAVVGAKDATKILKPATVVTVHGTKGEVYKGGFLSKQASKQQQTTEIVKTATKLYVNLAEPERALDVAQLPVDGVGLLRAEFMMAQIGTHPKKLIQDKKKQIFLSKLTEGLETICSVFYPRPVVYRTSDLKTNEYRNLVGGRDYEPTEENPMLGYRGAFRYIHDPEVLKLELEAVKMVRKEGNRKNLWLMIPFVRTPKELIEVKKIISHAGLFRSDSFKLWMMVELPSNVILLEKFIHVGIDGLSIGSNDLTMLILGTDRDNSDVANVYNEQDEAVLWAMEKVVKTASRHNVTSSICGQAPSLFPSLIEKLVSWGITSISVSADAATSVRTIIHEAEQKLAQ